MSERKAMSLEQAVFGSDPDRASAMLRDYELGKSAGRVDATMAALAQVEALQARITELERPIDMVMHCPKCGEQHIDAVTETWPNEPHRTHLCQSCGYRWRPADVATNGVAAVKTKGNDDDVIVTPSVLRIAASDVFQALEKASHGMYVDDAVPYALVEALGKALRGVK